eukprot:306594-Rhodomonas_salina.1
MINKLLVKCVHSSFSSSSCSFEDDGFVVGNSGNSSAAVDSGSGSGCEWVGSVEERVKHLAGDCAFSVLECSFEGCGAKVA